MALYNLTAVASNTTGLHSFWVGLNTYVLDGYWGSMLLLGILGILFMSLYFSTRNFGNSMVSTLFVSIILSIILYTLNLMSFYFVFVSIMGCAIATFLLFISKAGQ